MALPICEQCEWPVRTVFMVDGRMICKPCKDSAYLKDWKKDVATHMRRDEYPGGITLENYGAKPVTFYSESERLAYMQREGLEHREKWVPFPGTDRDPAGVQDSKKYIDPYTFENARLLMLRAAGVKAEDIFDSSSVLKVYSGSTQRAWVLRNIILSAEARKASHFHVRS